MKKSGSANTFNNGMVLDLHPMLTPNNVLTDALNATITTNNGNEGVLQNDMGNSRVESAYLPAGYAPIGTCEFGGIIYVLSYNPVTKKSLIGSFPSPETIQDSTELGLQEDTSVTNDMFVYNDETNRIDPTKIAVYNKGTQEILINDLSDPDRYYNKIKSKQVIVLLTPDYVHPGDKYMIYRNPSDKTTDIGTHVYKLGNSYAYVKITPVSVEESGKVTELVNYKEYEQGTVYDKPYFIYPETLSVDNLSNQSNPVTAYRQGIQNNYSIFSSKISGKLGLKFQLIDIKNLNITYKPTYAYKKDPDSQYDKNKYDILLTTTWEGDGVVDSIVVDSDNTTTKYPFQRPFINDETYTKYLRDLGIDTSFIKDTDNNLLSEDAIKDKFYQSLKENKIGSIISSNNPYYIDIAPPKPRINPRRPDLPTKGVIRKNVADPEKSGVNYSSNFIYDKELYVNNYDGNLQPINATSDFAFKLNRLPITVSGVQYPKDTFYVSIGNILNTDIKSVYEFIDLSNDPRIKNYNTYSFNAIDYIGDGSPYILISKDALPNDPYGKTKKVEDLNSVIYVEDDDKTYVTTLDIVWCFLYDGEWNYKRDIWEYLYVTPHDTSDQYILFTEADESRLEEEPSLFIKYTHGSEVRYIEIGNYVVRSFIDDEHPMEYIKIEYSILQDLEQNGFGFYIDDERVTSDEYIEEYDNTVLYISIYLQYKEEPENPNKKWILSAIGTQFDSQFPQDPIQLALNEDYQFIGKSSSTVLSIEPDPEDEGNTTISNQEFDNEEDAISYINGELVDMGHRRYWYTKNYGVDDQYPNGRLVSALNIDVVGELNTTLPTKLDFQYLLTNPFGETDNFYVFKNNKSSKDLILQFTKINGGVTYYWGKEPGSNENTRWCLRFENNKFPLIVECPTNGQFTAYIKTVKQLNDDDVEPTNSVNDQEETLNESNKTYYFNNLNELNKNNKLVYTALHESHGHTSEDSASTEDNVTDYTVHVCYPYGWDSDLDFKFRINWDDIDSGKYSIPIWKYYMNNDYMSLLVGFELYPLLNQDIHHIDLEFFDNQDNSTFIYRLEDRNSYSGIFNIDLPLNVQIVQNVIPNKYGHIGPVFDFDADYTIDRKIIAVNNNSSKLLTYKDGKFIDQYGVLFSTDNSDYILHYNDAGTLYSKLCYLVKIKVYTVLSESDNNPSLVYVEDKIMWTNGMYNEEFYNGNISDFSSLTPTLHVSSNLINTNNKESRPQSIYHDENAASSNDVIQASEVIGKDEVETYWSVEQGYNFDAKFTIQNYIQDNYNSFAISTDSIINNTVYRSEPSTNDERLDDEFKFIKAQTSSTFLNDTGDDAESELFGDDVLKFLNEYGEIQNATFKYGEDNPKSFILRMDTSKRVFFKLSKKLDSHTFATYRPIIYTKDDLLQHGMILENDTPFIENIVLWGKGDTDFDINDERLSLGIVKTSLNPTLLNSNNGLGDNTRFASNTDNKFETDEFHLVYYNADNSITKQDHCLYINTKVDSEQVTDPDTQATTIKYNNVEYINKQITLTGHYTITSSKSDDTYYTKWAGKYDAEIDTFFKKLELNKFCLFTPTFDFNGRSGREAGYSFGIANGTEAANPMYLTQLRNRVSSSSEYKDNQNNYGMPSNAKYFILGSVATNGSLHLTNTVFTYNDDINPASRLLSLLTQLYCYTGTVEEDVYDMTTEQEKTIIIENNVIVKSEIKDNIDHRLSMNGILLESYMNLLFKHAEYAGNFTVYNNISDIVSGYAYSNIKQKIQNFKESDKSKQEYLENIFRQLFPLIEATTKVFPFQLEFTPPQPSLISNTGDTKVLTLDGEVYTTSTKHKSLVYSFNEAGDFVSTNDANQCVHYNLYRLFENKDGKLSFKTADTDEYKTQFENDNPIGKHVIENFGEIYACTGRDIALKNITFKGDLFSYVWIMDSTEDTDHVWGGGWLKCLVDEKVFGNEFSFEYVNEKIQDDLK